MGEGMSEYLEFQNCVNCGNHGFRVLVDEDGEPEFEPCHFCHTEENSVFNLYTRMQKENTELKDKAAALDAGYKYCPGLYADAISSHQS
jgi:hypothetical protein